MINANHGSRSIEFAGIWTTIFFLTTVGYASTECQVLYAAPGIDVGIVCVENNEENLSINFQPMVDYTIEELHIFVGKEQAILSQISADKLFFDLFPYKVTGNNSDSHVVEIPLKYLHLSCDDTFFVVAHAALVKKLSDGAQQGVSAWAGDRSIGGSGNGATYFIQNIYCEKAQALGESNDRGPVDGR